MGEVTTIGLDLAKSIFQAHGADTAGGVVLRKKLRRDQRLAFFAAQPRCVVAMEARSGRSEGPTGETASSAEVAPTRAGKNSIEGTREQEEDRRFL